MAILFGDILNEMKLIIDQNFQITKILLSGRKGLIGLSLSLVTSATLVLTFGEETTTLSIGRFMYGTCLGISWAAVPLYIGEISEVSIIYIPTIISSIVKQ